MSRLTLKRYVINRKEGTKHKDSVQNINLHKMLQNFSTKEEIDNENITALHSRIGQRIGDMKYPAI